MKNKKIIGLTGNIGSGKSTALKIFKKLGFPTISSDEIAHNLLETEEIKTELLRMFGNNIFNNDNSINRSRLGDIVFKDSKKKLLLEALLHPKIEKEIYSLIGNNTSKRPFIIEMPLLFEAGWDKKVDKIVFINCPTDLRKKRYYEASDKVQGSFESREAAQINPIEKAKKADFVIDNSRSIDELNQNINSISNKL